MRANFKKMLEEADKLCELAGQRGMQRNPGSKLANGKVWTSTEALQTGCRLAGSPAEGPEAIAEPL